jgi:hypothetical protein
LAAQLDPVRPFTDWAAVFRYPGIDPLAAPLPLRNELEEAVRALEDLQNAAKGLEPPA